MKKGSKLFLKKMEEDKEFAEKILSQSEYAKVIELAKEEGIELTEENITKANEVLKSAMEQQKDGEISEEDLENVAGGGPIASALITASIHVGSAAAVASIGLASYATKKAVDEL